MIRQIIKIDENKCNGCGICATACHEGAIGMVDGKAKLLREDYCDGLGDCLPGCPTGAITFEMREAPAYDEAAVMEAKKHINKQHRVNSQGSANITNQQFAQNPKITTNLENKTTPCGCPGTAAKQIERTPMTCETITKQPSELTQWPVQIKLVPVRAPYFDNAHLLVAADCTAYAYGNFHQDFIRNKVTVIGCPKLDMVDYTEKLTQIIANNDIQNVTVVRMEVPCCGGIQNAVKQALMKSGKFIPWNVVTISTDGRILNA